jgi:type IV pilus assembly protein PilQ
MTRSTPSMLVSLLSRVTPVAWALPALVSAGFVGAAEPAVNVLQKVEVTSQGAESVVMVSGSSAPLYTAFRLDAPRRLVLDVASSDVSQVQGSVSGAGLVEKVSTSRFSDGKTEVGRIVVALGDSAQYDVNTEGNRILVHVHGDQTVDSAPPAKPDSNEAGADDHVVASNRHEGSPAHPASRVLSATIAQKPMSTRLLISTDADVGTYTVTELREPRRLAIDLDGLKGSSKLHAEGKGAIQAVRGGKHESGFRVVVDAAEEAGPYHVRRVDGGLAVVFDNTAVANEAVSTGPTKPRKGPTSGTVRDVSFRGEDDTASVVVAGSELASYDVSHPDSKTAVLTLHHTGIPSNLERSLDTSAYGAPVRSVSSFAGADGSGDVQIVAKLTDAATDDVTSTSSGLRWNFSSTARPEMVIDGVDVELGTSKVAGLQSEGPAYALSGAPRKPKYTGRRVSFEFKDIDIHNLLRIIAEVAKKNIVVSDEVNGKITIRLRNVPWDQALDVILKSKGLDKDESGNILRVLPAAKLAEERALEQKAREDKQNSEEPKLRLISVNYATANEMSERIKELLSKKGSVTVDPRTNTLIVKDVATSLTRVEGMVRTLDLQTPEVLIEARIVEANSTFSHDVGIQWGGQVGFAPAFGNPTGLIFPSTAVVTGASGTGTAAGVQTTPNFAVDLPAATGTGEGGGLGFIFGSAGGAATLNLRIAAAESSGTAKTISAPKVTTLDNLRATISQGVAIPFSQFSASGVNTSFIEAKLELSVTPHVTQDGSVQLKIDATNNQPNAGFTGSNGQPSITKKEAHTNVLVKDGDTTVIGGIYTRATGQNEAIVPVLGKIPVLGYFFRHRFETDSRTELLIFVTPHIVNRSQTVAIASPPPTNGNQ